MVRPAFALLALVVPAAIFANTLEERIIPDIDVCADIGLNLFTLLGLPSIIGLVSGKISVCLCLSTVPLFVKTNVVAQLAAKTPLIGVGETAVLNALVGKIKGGGHPCTYPDLSVPVCTTGNPCDWDCKDGFVKSGGKCICPPPKKICNGKCTSSPCPSGHHSSKKRSLLQDNSPEGFAKRAEMIRVLTSERCQPGQTLCGGWSGTRGWECIDTQTTLDSCGGCALPFYLTLPPYASGFDDAKEEGKDCSALPGVAGVACAGGKCAVHSCTRGWQVGPDGDECVLMADDGSGRRSKGGKASKGRSGGTVLDWNA